MADAKHNNSNEVGFYAEHLSEVNEVKNVIATEDICNEQGAILIKAGTAISHETTKRIINFKLTKPIEASIAIDNDIDGTALYKNINKIISDNEALLEIHKKIELDTTLKKLCSYYEKLPTLRQKMTVLSIQMQRNYTQSLLSAWVALLITKQLEMTILEIEPIFIASLTHDIGMLHIDKTVLNKKETLTADEWRQIKAHPIIGQNIINAIPSLPETVGIAILEHHERNDGTGYPAGKFSRELSAAGSIVALADSSVAVLERLRKNGRNLRDLIPILQINQKAHDYQVYEALLLSLKRSDLNQQGIIRNKDMPEYINKQLSSISLLSSWIDVIDRSLNPIGFTHKNRKIHAMQSVFINVAITITGSGILNESYSQFLEQAKTEKSVSEFREIEDVSLMLNEVHFHLDRLVTMMREYVDLEANVTGDISTAFAKAIDEITAIKSEYKGSDFA